MHSCLRMHGISLPSPVKITLWQTRRTVPLQTRQDAFGNGSSTFAFGFTGFGIPADECYFYSSRYDYDSHLSCRKAVYWCIAKQLKQTYCFKLFHCSFTIIRKLRDFLESFLLIMYIPGIKHFHKVPRNLFPLFKYYPHRCNDYCYSKNWLGKVVLRSVPSCTKCSALLVFLPF